MKYCSLTAHRNASAQATSPSTDSGQALSAGLRADSPTATPEVASASERPYRSYPAPTGYPAFRKYYQKRCYPGCHYDVTAGTPTPQAVHP